MEYLICLICTLVLFGISLSVLLVFACVLAGRRDKEQRNLY